MARGAKPKATALKVISGTHQPCRDNQHAPKITELGQIPPAPDTLTEIAAAKWVEIVPHLVRHKILTDIDLHNLEGFCQAYYVWRQAQIDIVDHGILMCGVNGDYKKNPAITASKEAAGDMMKFGSSLGLDPASRSRLVVGQPGKGNDFADF